MISNDDIKREFLAAGFTIKPGNDDLKPYVYEAARRVISLAESAEISRLRAELKRVQDYIDETPELFEALGPLDHGAYRWR